MKRPPIASAVGLTGAMSLLLLVAGCIPNGASRQGNGRAAYYGPTLPLDQVVAKINQNNSAAPTLWARVQYFEATHTDRKTAKQEFINGDQGTLLYTAPNSIRLTVNKDIVDLFSMATDGQRYWFWRKHENIFYWGSYANIARARPDQIPIRPDLVAEVLGIRPIDPDLLKDPFPVMRFATDLDAYMIVWQTKTADRWVAQKEIWYDRATFLPSQVILFDPSGRVVLRAKLSNFVPVADDDPGGSGPRVASHYELFFPESSTIAKLDLMDIGLTHNGLPKPVSYAMPDVQSLVEHGNKVIQIDAENQPQP